MSIITLALNVFLIAKIPKGFFPQQDTGAMMGGMQGPQDSSFYAMRTAVQQSVSIIKADPSVDNVMGFTIKLCGKSLSDGVIEEDQSVAQRDNRAKPAPDQRSWKSDLSSHLLAFVSVTSALVTQALNSVFPTPLFRRHRR